MSKLYDTKHYAVVSTDDAMGEDGKLGAKGYAVINKDTGVTEHTTVILPQAIYQAQGFNDSLDVLLKDDSDVSPLALVDVDVGIDDLPN